MSDGPFEWHRPDMPADVVGREPARAAAMYEREAEERAGLLYRLGYDRASAKARLRGNARWDWELHAIPRGLLKRLDEICDRVYARRAALPL